MLKKIKLYGRLRKFIGQSVLEADVNSPAEAIRFLHCNYKGLQKHMADQFYQINAGVGLKASTNYLAIALFLTPDDGAAVGYLNAYGNNDNYHSVPGCSTLIKATAGQEFAMAITDQYSTPNTAAHYCWFNACLVG